MTKPLILEAFEGKNKEVPVWFMRQAGRYLPEYRVIKEKHTLEEMFNNPELAARITCLPVAILAVDAAILFADILTLPIAMGFKIRFDSKVGPVVEKNIRSFKDLSAIHDIDAIPHIERTIKLVNERLPKDVPLIGFAGSPFTVLTYLMEGGSSTTFENTFRLMHEEPDTFHRLMAKLTDNTITYLNIQKKAGIQIYQIFDSWGGILRPADYAHFVLPYVKKIFASVNLSSIYYLKNTSHLLPLMDKAGCDFLSVDHTVVLGHHALLEHTKKGVQGNLFNGLLYAEDPVLEKEVKDVLLGGQKHKRFIFNLSHGIFPDVHPDKLRMIVEIVHQFPWKNK